MSVRSHPALVTFAAVIGISMFPTMPFAADVVRVEVDSVGDISLLSQSHFLERGSFATEDAPAFLSTASCGGAPEVHIHDLEVGIALGAQFLVNSQTDAGNFRYEYDWKARKDSTNDNVVRQAGTLWGLSLAHADAADELLLPAIRKTLHFFKSHTNVLSDGRRLLHYPGQKNDLGAVALITLAHIELLRQPQRLGGPGEIALLESDLDGYLKTILAGERLDGKHAHVFFKSYKEDGTPHGTNSPYYDGESLLALVKAAKYLGRSDLWERIERMAEAGWEINAEPGLKAVKICPKKATKEMKGYYQWSSMSYYELLGHDRQRFGKYAPRLLQYADWMVAKQEHAAAKGNSGYAFEGLIPAYLVSLDQDDKKRSNRLACVLRTAMHKLNGMQVGHPKARSLASQAPQDDERAQGGAQNALDSSALRIDTTQHQVHAILMMKLLMQKKELL